MDGPPIPRYGEASLADVVPSLLAAMGGRPNLLGIEPARRACLLLVDGLGWELVREHPDDAPFLARAPGRPITAGYPATTAASIASIGTGLPPGEHGLVGYAFGLPGREHAINAITWTVYGASSTGDLREQLVPEELQPAPTAFERAAGGGIDLWHVGPPVVQRSGLTRAALRGCRFRMALSMGDLEAESIAALGSSDRTFVYAYHAELDTTGHVRGTATHAWRAQLAHVDALATRVASRLGPDDLLVVTADHGMVDLQPSGLIDVDAEPDLARGVRLLGGEARARHVYAEPGAATDVLDAWRGRLGDQAWIVTGEQAVEDGWFGPSVPDRVRERIGDVVTASRDAVGIVQRSVDAIQATFAGHHGSMTPREQLVPLLCFRG